MGDHGQRRPDRFLESKHELKGILSYWDASDGAHLEEKIVFTDVKEATYKGLVRPVLEYGDSVWAPHTHGLKEELEKVQNHAARSVTGNYVSETGSMTGILGQLKWESLKERRKDSRHKLLYKGLTSRARILTDGLIPKNRRCRNQHSLAFQKPSTSKEA